MSAAAWLLIALGGANLALLFPPLRPAGAVLLALALPGWGWAALVKPDAGRLGRFALAMGLGYAITTLGTLLLHYLPGPIAVWQMAALLNAAALLPLVFTKPEPVRIGNPLRLLRHPLALVLIPALFLRFAALGYSEFQGDEALAMISAAEAITGHADALFLRGKGPGEVLLPAAVWRLSGPITEGTARLPFAIAGGMGIITLYLLAKDLFGGAEGEGQAERSALYGAALLAASGFMVGFSRIVQYQTLVVWMSTLAVWAFWCGGATGQRRWAFLSGLFLGVGLLAHYDAVLTVPAIGWLWLRRPAPPSERAQSAGAWLAGAAGSAALFYVPYFLDPQFSRTGDYLGGRIGEGLLKNNLLDFLHFHAFYSSFYYLLAGGLLLAAFVVWAVRGARWGGRIGGGAVGLAMAALSLKPEAAGAATGPLWSAILLAAFASPALDLSLQMALVWFAVPFLGYNFAVATPLTHIYTTLPGWALLAGWMASRLRLSRRWANAAGAGLLLLSTLYLWNAFLRHDVEFLQDYPAGNLPLFWTPFPQPPATGYFGFVHKSGWKRVGALVADGTLAGDYDSNEEEDVTAWYTRHAPRACDPGAEYYLIADDVIDPQPVPDDLLSAGYAPVGRTTLPNGKSLAVYQRTPPTVNLAAEDWRGLEARFDASAYPDAFARQSRPQVALNVNFGNQIRLVGYTLDARRPWPGGRVTLTLYWQAMRPLSASYKVFVHLDSERKYAQADSVPVCARYPTDAWRPGQTIADRHALPLAPGTPPGEHPLVVGLYLPDSGQRLEVLDAAGNPAGNSYTLTALRVE